MLWGTVHLNFYPIVTLIIVFLTALTGRYYGSLAHSRTVNKDGADASDEILATRTRYMVVPLSVMIVGMLTFMYWTGNGDLAAGNGSKSVLYATTIATLVAYLQMLMAGRFDHIKVVKIGFGGMSELLPLVAIVLLALTLGGSLSALGTGTYVAQLVAGNLPEFLIPAMLFLAGALISFSTGTF